MTVKKKLKNYEYAEPEAKALSQSLRAFGYDVSTAIADLIDNSITAGAENISIQFEWNDNEPWVAVIDDGCGMREAELFQAMKPGSSDPLDVRDKNDLGRFGLGLKTASFSQCRSVTVITKVQGGQVCIRRWDLDAISEVNRWILFKDGTEVSEQIKHQYLDQLKHGTIVLWEKLDRIIPAEHVENEDYQKAFLDYGHHVKEHISTVFSGYMSGENGICFRLNGNVIDLWDPFALDYDHTTILPAEVLNVNGKPVKIQSYVLPHQKWLSAEEYAKLGGQHGWMEQQGFYVYRNNRLIIAADWLIPGMEKKEQYKLARARIDIGNEMDEEWSIDVRKSIAMPPVSIRREIQRIARAVQKQSSNVYRHKGQSISRKSTESSFVWHEINRKGKIGYQINRNHPLVKMILEGENKKQVKQLLELIEETIPVPTIIAGYSEHSDEMLHPFEGKEVTDADQLIDTLLNIYVANGASPEKALEIIAGLEPFIYDPTIIELYRERKGLK